MLFPWVCFFFQAEDGIRDLVRSRGLGDVYKRQEVAHPAVQLGQQQPGDEVQAGQVDEDRRGLQRLGLSLIHI